MTRKFIKLKRNSSTRKVLLIYMYTTCIQHQTTYEKYVNDGAV